MKKEGKIPTIIGLLLLVVSLAAGVVLVGQRQLFNLRASPETTPYDVRVTNITNNSFSVTWTTSGSTQAAVLYGESRSLGQTTTGNKESTVHQVDLSSLKPDTQYFFKILSGTTTYDQNRGSPDDSPWTQKTATSLQLKPADMISGKIETKDKKAAVGALVYATITGGTTLSSLTGKDGSFSLNLATLRTSKLSTHLSYNNQTVISVLVKAKTGEIASAQVAVANARPIPTLTLGTTQDLRKTSGTSADLDSPKSNFGGVTSPSPKPTNTTSQTDLKFTSSPSAKTTAKPSAPPAGGPTASPTPTASPKPTVSPTLTPTLTTTPTSEPEIPATGGLTISILLFILGIGSISMGLIAFRTKN